MQQSLSNNGAKSALQKQQINILLVNDNNSVRKRLKAMLKSEPDLEIVGMAEDDSTAIERVKSEQIDIVLMDLEMPSMNGAEAIKAIVESSTNCKVIILTDCEGKEDINNALQMGAKGYIAKSVLAKELATAIRSVHEGFSCFSPGLFEKLSLAESESDQDSLSSTDLKASADSAKPKKQTGIFRAKSLERLSSPDRLDQLMQVVSPKSWLPLTALGSLIFFSGAWSIWGRIPITVDGRGMIVNSRKKSERLIGVTYFSIEDGKKVQPGMKIQITPQIVKRERYGGIVGNVTEVSSYPITEEDATKVIGNQELVRKLISSPEAGRIQVFANLQPDSNTFSNYKWSSSSGPKQEISPGTTTVARVKIGERRPIGYVIPILRSVSGIN